MSIETGNSVPGAPVPTPPGKGKPNKKKISWLVWLGFAFGIVVFVLLLGIGGFLIYTEAQYSQAQKSIEAQDYAGAQQCLSKVANVYKDTPRLMLYAQAGAALRSKDYYNARIFYQSLGSYKDSSILVQETDYQQADALLQGGHYSDAKKLYQSLGDYKDSKSLIQESDYRLAVAQLDGGDYTGAASTFQLLSGQNYKDSAVMVNETVYRRAVSLYDKKSYELALAAYAELDNYKDCALKLADTGNIIFEQAVENYNKSLYSTARKEFALVTAYNKDADKYLALIKAHEMVLYDSDASYDSARQAYDGLKSVGDFADSAVLKMTDLFIPYYLEGSWLNSEGLEFVKVTYDHAKSAWFIDRDQLELYCKFENGTYYYRIDYDRWMPFFRLTYQSDKSCKLDFCDANGGFDSSIIITKR